MTTAAVCLSMPTMVGAEGGAIRKADQANSWDFSFDITYADEATIDSERGSKGICFFNVKEG